MKSKISSFETIFRKDLFRFAPLWALYFIGGLMVTLANITNIPAGGYQVDALNSFVISMGIINLLYAALCAQVLFGDLFNSRLCNALHAMPLRRETWFLSHVAAGLCYSLVPHLAAMLLVALTMGGFWFVPLLWIAVSALEFLFFFGVAVLSCMCTGNRVAMLLVYGIINFISLLVYGFVQMVYMPQLRGLMLNGHIFNKLCPVVMLTVPETYFGFHMSIYDMSHSFNYLIRYFYINWEAWAYPATLAVLGLAALGLALLLYRRRSLECAGDFVAIRALDPVFTVIYTLSAGAVFALLGQAMLESYIPWLLVGLAVGYFTSRMFLKRTVKVFKARNFLYCGIFMAAMGLSIWITSLDPLGLTRWTPDPAEVKSATVVNHGDLTLTEPEDIEKLIAVHKQAISDKGDGANTVDTYIMYWLKDGSTRTRRYSVDVSTLKPLLPEYSAPERVMGYRNWDLYAASVRSIAVENQEDELVVVDPQELQELLEAIRKDCEAGIMAQEWFFRNSDGTRTKYYLNITASSDTPYNSHITVFEDGCATAWLKAHGISPVPQYYG